MALSAIQIVQAYNPSAATDPNIETHLELARLRTSSCAYGSKTELAVALRALHTYTLATTRANGESGVTTSKKEGDLAIGYSAPSGFDGNDLGLTQWGQQLQGLTNGSVAPIGVTGVGGFCAESFSGVV